MLDRVLAAARGRSAGAWFDAHTGKLAVAVTSQAAAEAIRAAGAQPKLVSRGTDELKRITDALRRIGGWTLVPLENAIRGCGLLVC
ncbi:hypothetical protein ACWGCW_34635 [Streptomyces sp. NPDC054933]